jgi:hypothetical protein
VLPGLHSGRAAALARTALRAGRTDAPFARFIIWSAILNDVVEQHEEQGEPDPGLACKRRGASLAGGWHCLIARQRHGS